MAKINPIRIHGRWDEGYALDLHTISSEIIGEDVSGKLIFQTIRTDLGELLFKLKYRSDLSVINNIIEAIVNFLIEWSILNKIDGIIPIPPSKEDRPFQPVLEIARQLSKKTKISLFEDVLSKAKTSEELKNIEEKKEREKILYDTLYVSKILTGKIILLLYDLIRSKATLNVATHLLYKAGASKVFVLTLTKTRTKI